jgi:sulfite exporter TauE/SafE
MTVDSPLTLGAALVLGLGGSVHCFAMCGPLACAAQGGGGGRGMRAILYHLARLVAYSVVGAVLGAASQGAARVTSLPVERALPWVLAAALVASAMAPRLRLRLRRPMTPGRTRAVFAWAARQRENLAPGTQAALLGALTPLLPCGVLYGIAAGALASGSAVRGASLMGAFAVAVVPALALAQWGGARLARFAPSATFARALPLVAAAALILRAAQISAHHGCH